MTNDEARQLLDLSRKAHFLGADTGTWIERLTPGREGFVVPHARDVGGLADAIVATADGRWADMSDAAARLGAQFDFDRHVEALAERLAVPCAAALR